MSKDFFSSAYHECQLVGWRSVARLVNRYILLLPFGKQHPLDLKHRNLVLLQHGGKRCLVQQFNRIEFSVLLSLPIEKLVGDADLLEVNIRVTASVERFAGYYILHCLPAQHGAVCAARLCLDKLSLSSR